MTSLTVTAGDRYGFLWFTSRRVARHFFVGRYGMLTLTTISVNSESDRTQLGISGAGDGAHLFDATQKSHGTGGAQA